MDLVKVVALPLAKRVAPVIAGIAAGTAIGFLLGRRRAHTPPTAVLADELRARCRSCCHESRPVRLSPRRVGQTGRGPPRRVRR
ncbi:hypothetical protein I552_0167 [Mycobacterium xenopi 3993]|nr:hypothetical protein I552_0167 [Mycobacterium xenopi 3993]